MGEKEKVTIMVLKVDLQCDKCYKKVKKVLCKFPQIRDQEYDEKNNQVIIKVVCCSPEKIRDKLCYKGCGAIKSIEIKEPEKPKPPTADKPKPKDEKPKDEKPKAEKPKDEKPKAEKPKDEKPKDEKPKAEKPKDEKPKDEKPKAEKPKDEKPKDEKPKDDKPPAAPVKPAPTPAPVPHYPAYPPVIVNTCCMDCYGGHPGGPCQTGYGGYGGAAPYVQYDGYYGRPVYDSYGGGRTYSTTSYCATRPDCFSEENSQACTIM